MFCRKKAEQEVPVSCEVSSNITSVSSFPPETEALYQTGCLEMLATVLGDNVVAVIITCVAVMVIQVSRVTFRVRVCDKKDSPDTRRLFLLLSGEVCTSATLGILKQSIPNIFISSVY